MVRKIAGVVGGYLVMVVFVFATFLIAYVAMGTGGAFQPGSYEVTGLWVAISVGLGLIAAIIGGHICSKIAPRSRAPLALALLVLILGLALAVPALRAPDEGPAIRTGEVGNLEAMQHARQPDWMLIANPIIGFIGVLIGARWRRPQEAEA